MKQNSSAYKFQAKIYDLVIYITYFLMIASALGVSVYSPKYLDELNKYVRIYICLFLIWRFNPLRKTVTFTDLDRKIVFSAGIFILTTTILNEYLILFKNTIFGLVHKI